MIQAHGNVSEKRLGYGPNIWAAVTYMVDQNGVPGSWLQSGADEAACGHSGRVLIRERLFLSLPFATPSNSS